MHFFNADHDELIEIYTKKKDNPAHICVKKWEVKKSNVKIMSNGVLRDAKLWEDSKSALKIQIE